MSLLNSLKKAFSKIMDFLKKLMKWLGPLIIIVLIVIAIFFPVAWAAVLQFASTAWTAISTTVGGWMSSAWGFLSKGAGKLWTKGAAWLADASFLDVLKLATGAAILLDPEGAASAAGSLLGSVGGVIADVATSLLGSNWAIWLGAGGVAWLLLKRKKDPPPQVVTLRGRL